jgi:hypothetical protein
MKFSKYFAKEEDAVPSLISKAGKFALALLLAMVFVVLGTGEGMTEQSTSQEWHAHVRSLRAQGKDVKVMKSKNMKPEKSPEEFLNRYKKIREQAGKNFTFQTFVEDVARGLIIEQRYDEFKGIRYIEKENRNPNYYWPGAVLVFNCDKFCITPELLKKVFGKENRIAPYLTQESKIYHYNSIGVNINVSSIPGINKKCASEAVFDTVFFSRIENL